jgi:bifunctional non-homologous end joining protein LigD
MDRFERLPAGERELLRASPHPEWVEPMLATLTPERFSDPGWIFERKLDGQRVLAFRHGGSVRLFSRNQKRIDGTYPEIVDALAAQPSDDFVIDGEVVAFDRHGTTNFSRLQQRFKITDPERARQSPVKVRFYVFDVMHLDGYDTTRLPVRARKLLLAKSLTFAAPLRYTVHRNATGEAYYAEAAAKGWEGVIGKRADSPYVAGRSDDWLKLKAETGQELVIGGFTDPSGSREGLGALLVGYYDEGGGFRYAGKVGTGYSAKVLIELRAQLGALHADERPFVDEVREAKAHWVRPELVAEIVFTEWTNDGKLRHPRFKGLRIDKPARAVVREAR